MNLRIENGIALAFSAAGVGFLSSSYNSYKANEKTKAMIKAATGVACFAIAYQSIHFAQNFLNDSLKYQNEEPTPIINISDPIYLKSVHVSGDFSILAPQTDGKECNIEEMHQYFKKLRDAKGPSLIEKYFIALENSKEGFSCENHMPFKKHYVGPTGYLDEVATSDAPKALSWGYDFWRRAFIVLRYKCPPDELIKSLTIFQRYAGDGTSVTTAGYDQGCLTNCVANILPAQPKSFSFLTDFFQKRILHSPCGDLLELV